MNRTMTLLLGGAVATIFGCASYQPDPELAQLENRYEATASTTSTGVAQDLQNAREAINSAREAKLRQTEREVAMKEHALAAKERALEVARAEAEQLASQLDELQAEVDERGTVLTLSDIAFDFDSADVKPGSERTLKKIATFLESKPERQIKIEGFTDSVGSDAYNEALSTRCADAVRDALVANGVSQTRIDSEGLGEQFPVASNDTQTGRAQNRRVEIIIGSRDGRQVSARS